MKKSKCVKTEYACPCCNGPIVHQLSNGRRNHRLNGHNSNDNGNGNGNGNDYFGKYLCRYCNTSIPWECLVLPATTRAISAPRFICINHGGCQSCHKAFARYTVNFWLSEAMYLENFAPRTASLCENCLRDITNTCKVGSFREIQNVTRRYRHLVARRTEVENVRTRKLISAWASQRNKLTNSHKNNPPTDSLGRKITAYPSAIRIRKCPKCGKPGYLDTTSRKCGKVKCRCRQGLRHGPYFSVHHGGARGDPQSYCHLNRMMLAQIENEVKTRM